MVAAQAVQRPDRPYQGLFGGGPPADPSVVRRELAFTGSLLGGYDDMLRLTGGAGVPLQRGESVQSGYSGTGDASLRFFLGHATTSVTVTGRAFSSAYSNYRGRPQVGGNMSAVLATGIGRRNVLRASQRVTYAPTLVLGAFRSHEAGVDPSLLPDAGERGGVQQQRSVGRISSLNYQRQLTTRHRLNTEYSFSARRYLDDYGFDDTTHAATVRYSWRLSRQVELDASYRGAAGQYTDRRPEARWGDVPSLRTHAIEAGVTLVRRISATRQAQLSLAGGTTYAESLFGDEFVRLDSWMPSGTASLRLDLLRTWSVAGNYRRGTATLQGITLETFTTDAAGVTLSGSLGRRIESATNFGYSTGGSMQGNAFGTYSTYAAATQFRYALARCCAASVNYDYNFFRVENLATVPTGFPTRYDTNGLRMGVTIWMPLYGSYDRRDEPRRAGPRSRSEN